MLLRELSDGRSERSSCSRRARSASISCAGRVVARALSRRSAATTSSSAAARRAPVSMLSATPIVSQRWSACTSSAASARSASSRSHCMRPMRPVAIRWRTCSIAAPGSSAPYGRHASISWRRAYSARLVAAASSLRSASISFAAPPNRLSACAYFVTSSSSSSARSGVMPPAISCHRIDADAVRGDRVLEPLLRAQDRAPRRAAAAGTRGSSSRRPSRAPPRRPARQCAPDGSGAGTRPRAPASVRISATAANNGNAPALAIAATPAMPATAMPAR